MSHHIYIYTYIYIYIYVSLERIPWDCCRLEIGLRGGRARWTAHLQLGSKLMVMDIRVRFACFKLGPVEDAIVVGINVVEAGFHVSQHLHAGFGLGLGLGYHPTPTSRCALSNTSAFGRQSSPETPLFRRSRGGDTKPFRSGFE